MPGSYICDHGGNLLVNFELGGAALTPPATWYFGLSKAQANKVGVIKNGYGNVCEVTGGSYARVPVTNNATNFPASSAGSKANGTAIVFPVPTADWGTIYSVVILDAASGGNVWRMIDLATPLVISSGAAAPTIAIGDLNFTHN